MKQRARSPRRSRPSHRATWLFACVLALAAPAFGQPVQFDFQGNPLSLVQGPPFGPVTAISGYLILDSADIELDVSKTYVPIDYFFTDGVASLGSADSFWQGGLQLVIGVSGVGVTRAVLHANDGKQAGEHFAFEMFPAQERSIYCVTNSCQGGSTVSIYLNAGGGTWSPGAPPTTVPGPGPWAGLVVLGAAWWLHFRHSSRRPSRRRAA